MSKREEKYQRDRDEINFFFIKHIIRWYYIILSCKCHSSTVTIKYYTIVHFKFNAKIGK